MVSSQKKHALRRLFRQKRLALSDDDYKTLSASVCDLLRLVLKPFQPQIIAGYWPICNEVDIKPLLDEWHQDGWTVCLPALNPDPKQKPSMLFREWSPKTTCHPNRFNIPEPPDDAPLCTPSILCTPCLAFDRGGHRLGYGKSYYDDYFDHTKGQQNLCFKIGVAFSLQEHADLPREKHDHPMNLVVTEKEIIESAQ